jgi:hypothetical protein
MAPPHYRLRANYVGTNSMLIRVCAALILSLIAGQYREAWAGSLLFTGSASKVAECFEATMKRHGEAPLRSTQGSEITLKSFGQLDVAELQQFAVVPPNQRGTEGFYRLQITVTPKDDANAEVLIAAIFFGHFKFPAGSARGPYPMGPSAGGRGRPSDWLPITSKNVLEARWEKILRSECAPKQ